MQFAHFHSLAIRSFVQKKISFTFCVYDVVVKRVIAWDAIVDSTQFKNDRRFFFCAAFVFGFVRIEYSGAIKSCAERDRDTTTRQVLAVGSQYNTHVSSIPQQQ